MTNKYATITHTLDAMISIMCVRIPNPQPNLQILPESVRVRIRGFFCSRKWRFWVVGSRVYIYLSGGGVQATMRNCVWPPVWPCERLQTRCRRRPSDCSPPRCLVGHTCLGMHQWRLSVVTSQLQIIIWSSKSGRVTTTVQDGSATNYGK